MLLPHCFTLSLLLEIYYGFMINIFRPFEHVKNNVNFYTVRAVLCACVASSDSFRTFKLLLLREDGFAGSRLLLQSD